MQTSTKEHKAVAWKTSPYCFVPLWSFPTLQYPTTRKKKKYRRKTPNMTRCHQKCLLVHGSHRRQSFNFPAYNKAVAIQKKKKNIYISCKGRLFWISVSGVSKNSFPGVTAPHTASPSWAKGATQSCWVHVFLMWRAGLLHSVCHLPTGETLFLVSIHIPYQYTFQSIFQVRMGQSCSLKIQHLWILIGLESTSE